MDFTMFSLDNVRNMGKKNYSNDAECELFDILYKIVEYSAEGATYYFHETNVILTPEEVKFVVEELEKLGYEVDGAEEDWVMVDLIKTRED